MVGLAINLLTTSDADLSHVQEWEDSNIAPDLIKENLISLDGYAAMDRVLISEDLPKRTSNMISTTYLKKYDHLNDGGWYCKNYDPLNDCENEWIQFKPNKPRITKHNGFGQETKEKTIKYETPPKIKAGLIFPYVPKKRWQEIADKYDTPITDEDTNFWQWVINHPSLPITISEGAKKTLALLSQNIIAIGVPGIWMGTRKISEESTLKQLHPQLNLLTHKKRKFSVCFDQDTKLKTRKAVNKAIFALANELQKAKCKVSILSWHPELGKGVDDVLFNSDNPQSQLQKIYENALTFSLWASLYHFKLSKADLILNCRYLSEGLKSIPNERLIAIKSPQATGKTQAIALKVKEYLCDGIPCFILVHLESLAKALAQTFGVAYRTESDPTKGVYGYSLCVDSLMPKKDGVNPDDWDELVLIVDEVDQVLSHLLTGNTAVADYRPTILKTLSALAPKITQCIIADADLTDTSVKFFENLLGEKAFIIKNEYRYDSMKFYKYNCPSRLLSQAMDWLGKGQKLFIPTSSQKPKSKFGSIAIENFIKKKYPKLQILRIDSESIQDPEHQAYRCLGNLNQIIKDYDVIICSPSLQTGVSIDLKNHFDKVVAFSMGNITPQSFLQSMWRLRDLVERHFYCKPTGNTYIGNSSCSSKSVLESNQKTAKYAIAQLGSLDTQLRMDDVSSIYLETWAKIAARINASSRCYGDLLNHLIVQQGHELIVIDNEQKIDNAVKDEIKENAKECLDYRNSQILAAPDIEEDVFDQLEVKKSSFGLTLDELCTCQKFETLRRYGGQISQDILEFDDDGKYSALRTYYYLTQGREFLKQKDTNTIEDMAKLNDNNVLSFDVNKKAYTNTITALETTKMLDLIQDLERWGEFHHNDPLILQTFDHLSKYRDSLSLIGVHIGKQPISAINSLLRKIGHKIIAVEDERGQKKRMKKDGETIRVYKLEKLPEWSSKILNLWYESDLKKLSRESAVTDSECNENLTKETIPNERIGVSEVTDSLYINRKMENQEICHPQNDERLGREYRFIPPNSFDFDGDNLNYSTNLGYFDS